MLGKVTIHQEPNGRCTGVDLDGQKLPYVRSYTISHTVGDLQLVTITFVATAEIISDRRVAPHGEYFIEPEELIDTSTFDEPHRVSPRD